MSDSQHLSPEQPRVVLLVEDDENAAILAQEAFRHVGVDVDVHHVGNGHECLRFLRKEGKHTDAPAPDMLLLDLNMPVMDGRQVLEAVASDARFRHLPVIVLTTSRDQGDIMQMYRQRCSSYIIKPADYVAFKAIIRAITDYWFSVATLPQVRGGQVGDTSA